MYEVTLNRDQWYHRWPEVYRYLQEHFGGLYPYDDEHRLTLNKRYRVEQMFGQTHINFPDKADHDQFQAWVNEQSSGPQVL